MKARWGKNNLIRNEELCFSLIVAKGRAEKIRLIAKDIYNLFVNGEFVHYGPARSAKGTARVDEIDLANLLVAKENRIDVFVQSNNTKTMCFSSDEPYFGAEVLKGEEIVFDTDDFKCYFMTDKLVKVEKMSYQRSFLEIYDMQEDRKRYGRAFRPIETILVKTPKLLRRNVHFAKNERVVAKRIEEGCASFSREVTWSNDFTRNQLDNGINLFGYTRRECEVVLSYELDKIVFGKGDGLWYKTFAFENISVGKFFLKIKAKNKANLWFIYDDLLLDGKIQFNREQIIHALKWTVEEGEYDLISNEVYQAKYITVLTDGEIEFAEIGIIKIENPDVEESRFVFDDEELTKIVQASIRTFRQNAYDLPTDCASRERAGYLCDGYFTAVAERFFTGDNKTERNLLENYLYYKNETYSHDGILPMCYPSVPKGEDDYIPNWMLWYIVQLADFQKRTGDREFVLKHKAQVYKTLDYFTRYENEYGLLENLGGWVFVEWSKANDFISGVNFPSNMLYAGALASAGAIFNDENLTKKSKKVKTVIKELAFRDGYFVDNAVRVDGRLTLTENVSETCQNYAIFFDIINKAEHPEFFARLSDRFGAFDDNQSQKVWRSNMFIGFILRLMILYNEEKYELLLKESKEAFLPMVNATGTIWEHFEEHSSCNHGFGSIVGVLIAKSIEKIRLNCEKPK